MRKFFIPFFALLIVAILALNFSFINSQFYNLSDCHIAIEFVGNVSSISNDSSNKVPFVVRATDRAGAPLPHALIRVVANAAAGAAAAAQRQPGKYGAVVLTSQYTDQNGTVYGFYFPEASEPQQTQQQSATQDKLARSGAPAQTNLTATATNWRSQIFGGTIASDTISAKITPTPVVIVHGYQQSVDSLVPIYENLKGYSPNTFIFKYDSTKGAIYTSEKLRQFLISKKVNLLKNGTIIDKFDIVSYSFGGLIARQYTTDKMYNKNPQIRKLLFLSVPHSGTAVADIAASIISNQSIIDLSVNSAFINTTLANNLNHGLNPSIQTANLLGNNDEVVTPNSCSLQKWGIETELFDFGEPVSKYENFETGNYTQAYIHTAIINNKNIFSRIKYLLQNPCPYPAKY